MGIDPIADAAVEATFAALALPVSYMTKLGPTSVVQALHVRPQVVLDGLGGGRQVHDGLIVQIRAVVYYVDGLGEDVLSQRELGAWRERSGIRAGDVGLSDDAFAW